MHVMSRNQIAKYLKKLFRNIGGVDDLKLSRSIGGVDDLNFPVKDTE